MDAVSAYFETPGGEPRLTPVHAALAVQFLTRQASRADWFEVSETVIRLVSAAITGPGRRPSPPRATTEMAWRRLADGTKQILSYDPGASLHELARRQSVSPWRLSHVFHLHRQDRVRLPQPASGAGS